MNPRKEKKTVLERRQEHARMFTIYKMREDHPEIWNAAIDEVLRIIGKRKLMKEFINEIDGLKVTTHLND